ncbi:MAG: DUF899 family protein [Pseudomonadales bacterium]
MSVDNPITFAGESADYRSARNQLLQAEMELRRKVAEVAALRSALPPGHSVTEDYEFERQSPDDDSVTKIALSSLFSLPDRSLVIYSFMNANDSPPCPMCNAFLDAFNGVARHARSQLNIAVVAKAGAGALAQWAQQRGWSELQLLSSANNDFNKDYLAESPDGQQLPMLHVFQRTASGVQHSYSTELFFQPPEAGQHPRHMDMLYPLWNLFDLTPEGRPENWMPSIN